MATAFPVFRWIMTAAAVLTGLLISGGAYAQDKMTGQPYDWQLGLQRGVTSIADEMADFHNLLLVIITVIVIFVLFLLLWVMFRYNEKANPVPSKNSHNTTIEVIWTLVPILILLVIAVPSFRLLSNQYTLPKADLLIQATGNQWYWSYKYPDADLEYDANMLSDEDIKKAKDAGQKKPRLLATDNPVVVPVNKVVHVLVDASDVLHNWTIPAFGVKMDAIPGAPKRIWFKVREEGVYYGQCSEMCGMNHAFMPIEVHVVSEDVYNKWLEASKEDIEKGNAVLKQAALERKKKNVAALAGE